MSETQLLSAILQAISLEPQARFWRNNAGARKGGRLRYGLAPGAADIIGIVGPAGKFVALEVKTEDGVISDEQTKWGLEVLKRGGYYAVVRSVPGALREVRRARQGHE